MTQGIDNDEWLKSIGAVTAGDDDPDLVGSDEFDPAEEPLSGTDDDGTDDDHDQDRDPLPASLFGADEHVIDLDAGADHEAIPNADAPPRRFTPWVLAAFGAAAVVATVITLVVTMANSSSTESATTSSAPVPPRTVEVAPPSPPPNLDGPLPFTASSDCPPGSTAAQSVADPNSTTPWVCVRSVDGQVLEIDLGRTFVITAVSIVPGAINKTETPTPTNPIRGCSTASSLACSGSSTTPTAR